MSALYFITLQESCTTENLPLITGIALDNTSQHSNQGRNFVRSEVLTAVTITIIVFWNVTLCDMINVTNVLEEPAACLVYFKMPSGNIPVLARRY
jgi:hypothetical protein